MSNPTHRSRGLRGLLLASVILASLSAMPLGGSAQAAPLSKPTITLQPTDKTVRNGETNITFRSKGTGNPTPTVTWEVSQDEGKTFTALMGQGKEDLDIGKIIADSVGKDRMWYANGFRFRATYSNSQGTATSDTVILMVLVRPVVGEVADQSVKVGQKATFTVTAFANPKPTVQWQLKVGNKPWADIPGATMVDNSTPPYSKSTYTSVPAPLAANGWMVRARFTNSIASEDSNAATLTVTQ